MKQWFRGAGGSPCSQHVFLGVLFLVATVIPDTWAAGGTAEGPGGSRGVALAEAFVRNSPTFRFDGIEDSLRLESVRSMESCLDCYEYAVYFENRHPGYGDRTGLEITPGRTPHRATIVLVDQDVVTGVLDNAWDITNQLIVDFE
jgi:hypothetical protein